MASEKEKKVLLATGEGDATLTEVEEKALVAQSHLQDNGQEEEANTSFFLFRLPLFQWKTIFFFVGISLGIIFHWFSTSELFSVPEDVAIARSMFFKAKESYFLNNIYWDAKQRHFSEKLSQELLSGNDREVLRQIQDTPGEIFISFLLKRLHLGFERLERCAIFPREDSSNCTVIISKPENSIWPLTIMLALELEVKVHAERFSLSVSRLRRGSQDIALGLAWTYFGPELESIRQLESTSKQSFILLSTTEDLQ
jgi:hypothetical protein